MLLPGFVDTHVHFPQVRVIGGLGMPLLDWLERCALPEEARLGRRRLRRRRWPASSSPGWSRPGTTTALVFGAHFAPRRRRAVRRRPPGSGLRITSGLVVSDRILREDAAHHAAARLRRGAGARRALARRRAQPLRRHPAVLALVHRRAARRRAPRSCSDVAGSWFTSHINENPAEVDDGRASCSAVRHYLDTYDRHGLVGRRSVLAHNVHPTDAELAVAGRARAPASRTARPATPRSAAGCSRCARHVAAGRPGRARLRRRRRHRVLAVQGGAAGLLRAAAARRPGAAARPRPTCSTWRTAAGRRGPRASATRSAT